MKIWMVYWRIWKVFKNFEILWKVDYSVWRKQKLPTAAYKRRLCFLKMVLRLHWVLLWIENELKQKDVIKFLTIKLVEDNCQVVSKVINANVSLVQSNDSEESSDDSKIIKNSCNGANEQFKKRKIIVGDSLLNGINLKGLLKNHSVKVNNTPGGTSDAILDELDDFLKSKPDGTKARTTLPRGEINWITF